MSNIYYWEKLTFSELRFSMKRNLKKCTSFDEQKVTRYIPGKAYFGIIVFSCLLSTNLCLRFLLICFAREIKSFNQSSLENEIDFINIMNLSLNILTKNKLFKKLRRGFVNERQWLQQHSSSSHWKICIFLLANKNIWKSIFNTNSELHRIVQKNNLIHSKQQ